MTSRLDITAPATITVLGGSDVLSSLDVLPPGGISVADVTGVLTVQVVAGNAGTALSASATGGAAVSSTANTVSITGTALQVNEALASLEAIEPTGETQDILTMTASDPGFSATRTNIDIVVVPTTGPAFVAPKLLVTLQPDALNATPYLFLSDPIASGLAAMGLGREETLSLSLSVTSGILLLPGFTDASAIAISGLGTGTLELSFTADQIGALNTLLAGLEFVGPTGGEHLSYALRNQSGVLPDVLTFGNIFLNIVGTPGNAASIAAGSQNLLLGDQTLAGTIAIAGTTTVLGDIGGAGAVMVAPDGNLELPYNTLSLGGTSLDFGNIAATTLVATGTLVIGDGAGFAGQIYLGPAGLLDFAGMLVADGAEAVAEQLAVSLGAGAVLTGNGTLMAGNFSESGLILGPGTILALGGETLLVAAGSIGGGAQLAVADGGVMVLGPVSPLFGVFDVTPLTIDNSVTLSFLDDGGATGVTGQYAGTLGGNGGAFVIDGPQAFSGTIIGFTVGDQLIFPDLTDVSISDTMPGSFTVSGRDGEGDSVQYTLFATTPAGTIPVAGLDAGGDPNVMLQAATAGISRPMAFTAGGGTAQPLLGLSLNLAAGTTQNLRLTLSVASGTLTDGSAPPGAVIVLTAANITAMNAALGDLSYTGTGIADALTIASASGILAGLNYTVDIDVAAAGTVDGDTATMFSESQTASFGLGTGLVRIDESIAAGDILVDGTTQFTDMLQIDGISGTSLVIEAGADAIFDASAAVALGADVTIGDAAGSGTLVILTNNFSTAGNVTVASNPNAAAYVLGALTIAGTLAVGAALDLSGSLMVQSAFLGTGASLFAYGNAAANFGDLDDNGSISLDDTAHGTTGNFQLAGAFSLGGTAAWNIGAALTMTAGTMQIGADATLDAGTITLNGGAVTDAGILSATGSIFDDATITISGGTIAANFLSIGGTLAGFGDIDAATLANAGLILAQNGLLLLDGSICGNAIIEIAATAALDIAGGISTAAPITFLGPDAMLTINDTARFGANVQGMAATDAIDLVGIAPSLVSYSSLTGMLIAEDSEGDQIAAIGLQIRPGQPPLSIVMDGFGGALITLGDELPCFARGTNLLTPHGYRAVETLKPGDPLITMSGTRRPVRWVGHRTLDLGPRTARFALPVVIKPNAFGPGLPLRPLRLSPLHCVYADGVLIPVTHLVNGATIIREAATAAMTYYHVELDRHDVLLAEGLPCESYFDAGNRGALYHETGRRSPTKHVFAPSVTTGAKLAAVRRRLHDIALRAGFTLTYWPVLRAVAGGQTLTPEIHTFGPWRMARFAFAHPARDITLLSASACPADTDPACEDRRELGVCIAATGDIILGQGWHPRAPADAGHWMGRVASLRLHRAEMEITLPLAAIVQNWVRPMVDATPGPA